MSRAQDPQLHTHVVCANMAQGEDGRWTALDGTAIYEHAKAGGFVYEAHLCQAVRGRVPWAEWGPVRNGIGELVQVPGEVREEFSQRRHRILEREAELEAAGVSVGHKGRERIAYDTRESKKEIAERDWRADVRARAEEHGLGPEQLAALAALPHAEPERPVSPQQLAERLFSSAGLTAMRNTFVDRDVVIGVAEAFGQGAPAGEVVALAGRMAGEPEVVALPAEPQRRYTTRELLDAEELIVVQARDGRDRQAGVLDPDQVEHALVRLERKLSGEQARAVAAIATAGHRVDTVEALAGTGKTTSANALREVYERAGFRVIGAAPTGRAVRELKERGGILESRTLDSWALKIAADPTALSFATLGAAGARRQPAVMIIDEAGMAHTRLSARVIEEALDAKVKVVAIGDSGQLSSVQAGGWLGALTRELGSHELREVMRQRDPRERRLLAHVHRGEPDAYLALKTERGELRLFGGEQPAIDAENAIIDRWAVQAAKHGVGEAVMISRENDRRERLNALARQRRRDNGELGESVEIAQRDWAVGDRVIARRNDRGRDLDNGMRGTLISVDEERERVIMRADAGGERLLDRGYIEQHLQHAYALTGHGMQGGTVTWAAVIGAPGDFSRNWSYTALSRAREPTQIYLVDEPARSQQEREQVAPAERPAEDRDALELMARRMQQRDDEDLALEQLQHAQEDELARADPDQDREEHQSTPAPDTQYPTAMSGRQPVLAEAERSPVQEDVAPAAGASKPAPLPDVSPTLQRVYELEDRLSAIAGELKNAAVENARAITRLRDMIAAVEREHERDRRHSGGRDRARHQARVHQREQRLAGLRADRDELLARTPGPQAVLEHADQLVDERERVIRESLVIRARAIDEELSSQPPWLGQTLGPEPGDGYLQGAWQQAARQTAGWRIDQRITDPHVGLGPDPGGELSYHALRRTIADTRGVIDRERTLHQAPASDQHDPGMVPAGAAAAALSATLERVYELDERLSVIADELKNPAVEDARAITRLRDTIAAVEGEHDRDRKPNGWRDRSGHQVRVRVREQQLAKLRGDRDELLQRTPDPEAVLERADALRDEQQRLMRESLDVGGLAIDEQLASQPPWLTRTLGPKPEDEQLRGRWRYAARETAGYRIEQRITDPQVGLGPDPGADSSYRAARRTIIDARRALGLDQAQEQDRELGY
jgi:AAA domain/TrwC relaxase